MKRILLTLTLAAMFSAFGQIAYTENTYAFSVTTDIEYGIATNFAGQEDTLLLDIYRPVGDENCNRPCLVLVHGGAWIGGSKNDVSIVNIAQSFAEKGWVVAAINYRLGTHKTPYYDLYPFCAGFNASQPCGYVADSAEVYRANYRGQQDAKGAIRFMKNRALLDSIDVQNVFIAGESAGGFVSLAAAFTDQPDEKSDFCYALPDAPTPDADLVFCLPEGYSLNRPDLGDIDGTLNLGGYDASVEGVGNLFGGMLTLDLIEGDTEWPVVYMFHQGNDVVVHYNYGRLLGRLDWECYAPTSLCQPYARYPKAYGSKGLETHFSGLSDGPERLTEIIENYEYNYDCLDTPPGHSIDNWVLRSDNMATTFAERVAENGNTPWSGPCGLSIPNHTVDFRLYPNPSSGTVNVTATTDQIVSVQIYSSQGQLITAKQMTNVLTIDLNPGIYIFQMESEALETPVYKRVIISG